MVDKKSNSRIPLEYIIPHEKGKSFDFVFKSSHLLKTFNFKKMIVPIKAYFIKKKFRELSSGICLLQDCLAKEFLLY